jgi:hypothetical protein
MPRNLPLGIATPFAVLSIGVAHHWGHAALERHLASTIEDIGSPALPGSGEPNLAVDRDGRVYMSWLEPAADSAYALRFATHDGTRWSTARTIRSGRDFFVNWADFPSIEVVGANHVVAHWLQRNGRGSYAYGVRISQSRDGGVTWSAPITPHRDGTQTEHGFVALWPERGSTGAVWLDGRKHALPGDEQKKEMMLVSTTVSATGVAGAESSLDARTCDCCQTAAAVTANGPIVVYRDRSPDEIRDIYVVRRVGGRWTTPAPVSDDAWQIAACPVNGPAVGARGESVAVAWFTAAGDSPRVKLAFSKDAGATFEKPIVVDGGNPAGRVDVALLRDGSALVSWIERTGGDTAAVLARRVRRDGGRGTPVTIANSSAARASGFPRMAVTGDRAMFAWTEPGKPAHVRVARVRLDEIR